MHNPYRSGSFQLGAEKGSQTEDCSENIVFYLSNLKGLIWVTFYGALSLKHMFFKTHVNTQLHNKNTVELRAGNSDLKQVMELRRVFAQLTGGAIKNLGALALNHDHGLILDRFHGAQPLN